MTHQQLQPPPPAPPVERRRVPWRQVALVAGAVAAGCAVVGAGAGWLWYQWWAPANTGTIYDTVDGPKWYDLTDQGVAHQFDGPAQYAVVALVFGAALGVLAVLVGRRQPVAAVAGLIVGTAAAAYLCYLVGTELSPPDPQEFATEANIDKEFPAAIEVSGWTPFLCWPLGALGAYSVAVLVMSWLGTTRSRLEELPPLVAQPARVEAPGGVPVNAPDDRPAP